MIRRQTKPFLLFLEEKSNFSREEKDEVKKELDEPYVFLVFRLSILLITWSTIMAFVDLFFISGLIIYLFSIYMNISLFIIIPIAFLVINIIFKYLTITFIAGGRIKCTILLIASLPYIGFAFLLGHTIKNRPIFRKAISQYIAYKRKNLFD